MPTQDPLFHATGPNVGIRPPTVADGDELIALAAASTEFLRPWIDPPSTPQKLAAYLARLGSETDRPFLVCELASRQIVGVINVSCIVRGLFESAYLGYWIGASFARRGYMGQAMPLLVRHMFGPLGLHRLEANIQPGNTASIALARQCGFRKEGYSPKYLRVFGEWRDHERWAIRRDGP